MEKFELLWKVFLIEMQLTDSFQQEMLQMMLKRFLILCAKIYREQKLADQADIAESDMIREFNFLVESHFKYKHSVSEYAAMLNKTPKYLATLFKRNKA